MNHHKTEAVRNIDGLHDYQSEEGMSDASMLTVAIEAQAHATLYLAEQQRIANLIAWWEANGRLSPESQDQIVNGLGL